jgi:hypothetical protein
VAALSAAPALRELRLEPVGDDVLLRAYAGRWRPPAFE